MNMKRVLIGIVVLFLLTAGGYGIFKSKTNTAKDGVEDFQRRMSYAYNSEGPAGSSNNGVKNKSVDKSVDNLPAKTNDELQQRQKKENAKVNAEEQKQPENRVENSAAVTNFDKTPMPRAIGDPNAPVRIIEYSSFTCGHCAHFHKDTLPELKEKYIDTGKVYMIFREFPLNAPSLRASMVARCLPEERYVGFAQMLFETADKWASGDYMENLKRYANLAGMSAKEFDECVNSEKMRTEITRDMQEASQKWGIDATPTFVLNGGAEIVSGAQPLYEFERIFRKLTNNEIGSKK